MDVNPTKEKKLTNIRTHAHDEALRLTPPPPMTLESAIEFIAADELVEVTPNTLRLRKRMLSMHDRRRGRGRESDLRRASRRTDRPGAPYGGWRLAGAPSRPSVLQRRTNLSGRTTPRPRLPDPSFSSAEQIWAETTPRPRLPGDVFSEQFWPEPLCGRAIRAIRSPGPNKHGPEPAADATSADFVRWCQTPRMEPPVTRPGPAPQPGLMRPPITCARKPAWPATPAPD